MAARAEIRQDHAPNLPSVRGDRTQLRQVLVNLIMNATEALGDDRATIQLSTSARFVGSDELAGCLGAQLAPGEYVVLSVLDNGCGMSTETMDRIFEPFYSTKVAGRGMGLAATLGIVRAHGGAIYVESTLGTGSAFRVLLPAEHEPASRRSTPLWVRDPSRRARGALYGFSNAEGTRI